eukprot:10864010-Alexandrium_andersonii.AAC.1
MFGNRGQRPGGLPCRGHAELRAARARLPRVLGERLPEAGETREHGGVKAPNARGGKRRKRRGQH